jgi:hypothetical protein
MNIQYKKTQNWLNRFRSNFKSKATGSLKNTKITFDEKNKTLEVEAKDYLKYIDEGVNGKLTNYKSQYSFRNKKPPVKELSQWAKSKGINVWALQKSIYKKGIKPRNLINEPLENELDSFANNVAEDIANTIEQNIKQNLNKIK